MIDNYEILENGLIRQVGIFNEIQKYDVEYVEQRYNQYGEKGPQMAGLRLGFLIGTIGFTPNSILDIGYGNGDFLKVCEQSIESFGNDVSGYPVPKNTTYVENIFDRHYDVVCMFDVLEHFQEIDFVKNLNCDFVYVSLPWCHNLSDSWFESWKHRRPDEHFWHFNENSITNFFDEMGFDRICYSNIEDVIRKPTDNYPNILSCIFKKRN